jgi:hypothetical protein
MRDAAELKALMETARIQTTASPLAAARHWLWEELWRIIPIAGFFLVGFMLVLLIVKLTLAEYSIEISTASKAVLGALIAAKVVLILNRTPLSRSLASYPRILPVIARTIFYGVAFIFLALAERIIEQRHEHGGLAASAAYVAQHTDMHRLMALSVGVALVFCAYFILSDIGEYLGEGVLIKLFFKTGAPLRAPNARA